MFFFHDDQQKTTMLPMELDSCQNPEHTQNVFCSRITIHTHTKRVLLTQNDSHTRSVWFANTKHHSQTNAFCFRNKYSMFYTKYKKKSFKYTKQFYKYGTRKLRVDRNAFAHGSDCICARISKAEN